MSGVNRKVIYTIGHSTRTLEEFIKLLSSFKIELVADIRSFPESRKFPQFNKEIYCKRCRNLKYHTSISGN